MTNDGLPFALIPSGAQRRDISGARYAMVFPEPVSAAITDDFPSSTGGIARLWIAVGSLRPVSASAFATSDRRPSDSHCEVFPGDKDCFPSARMATWPRGAVTQASRAAITLNSLTEGRRKKRWLSPPPFQFLLILFIHLAHLFANKESTRPKKKKKRKKEKEKKRKGQSRASDRRELSRHLFR